LLRWRPNWSSFSPLTGSCNWPIRDYIKTS
jgi:hypothetical protein